jgi:hypothetical protein
MFFSLFSILAQSAFGLRVLFDSVQSLYFSKSINWLVFYKGNVLCLLWAMNSLVDMIEINFILERVWGRSPEILRAVSSLFLSVIIKSMPIIYSPSLRAHFFSFSCVLISRGFVVEKMALGPAFLEVLLSVSVCIVIPFSILALVFMLRLSEGSEPE